MEFGRVDHLNGIDYSLPPDDPMTDELLSGLAGIGKKEPNLYVGCAKWGRKDWIGKVYPKGTREKDFLAHYVRQFNCIELNALFYHLQPKKVIEGWAALAGPGFRFCPKFSNTISHHNQLQQADAATDLFMDHMKSFGDKLGPSFLQLSDSFGPDRAVALASYLEKLPRNFKTCLELRHEDWFNANSRKQGGGNRPDSDPGGVKTWQLMRTLGIGSVITDTSGRRDCLHMKLTAPVAFIRYVGNNLHPTDFARIDAWVDRICSWIGRGLTEIYFFIHSHEERYSPELCRYAIGQFNSQCGTSLQAPRLQQEEGTGPLTLF